MNHDEIARRNRLLAGCVNLCEAAKVYAELQDDVTFNMLCDAALKWAKPVSEVRLRLISKLSEEVSVLRSRVQHLEVMLSKASKEML